MALKSEQKIGLALGRQNFILIVIGFAIVVIGYLLMIGGKSESIDVYNPEVFSFRRITLSPLVILLGYIFIIYAIMKKTKESKA